MSRLNSFSFLLAVVVLVFAIASTVNGQRPPFRVGEDVVTVHDGDVLTPGEGFPGPVPSWFLLVKVEAGHSTYFGSGTFITDRLVLTCYHNIRGFKPDQITLKNGPGDTFEKITVALQSPKLDLALLYVEDKVVPYHRVLPISGEDFKPEGSVYSVGFDPSEDAICVYKGKLSGTSYSERWTTKPVYHGHSAKVVQGMSGGPLVNHWGEIVGVNVAASDDTSLAVNLTRLQWFLDQYDGKRQDE